MTRDEIKTELDNRGITYNGRWNTKKLAGLIDVEDEEKSKKEPTVVGAIIPKPTYEYCTEVGEDYADVMRERANNKKEFVRKYSLADHGEAYKELAEQFTYKMNSK